MKQFSAMEIAMYSGLAAARKTIKHLNETRNTSLSMQETLHIIEVYAKLGSKAEAQLDEILSDTYIA